MLRTMAALLAATALSAVIAACGGDGGGMDAQAYLEALDDRLNQADDESEALFNDPEFVRVASSSGPLSEADREIARDALESVAATFDSFLADVEDLDPPEELQEEHDELLSAYRALDEQFSELVLGRVDDAETIDDINQAFDDLAAAAGERTSSACLAMQAEAEVNGVDVDLNC